MTDTRIDVRDLRVLRVRALQLAAAEGLQFTAPNALPAGNQATTSPLPQPTPTRPAKARPCRPPRRLSSRRVHRP